MISIVAEEVGQIADARRCAGHAIDTLRMRGRASDRTAARAFRRAMIVADETIRRTVSLNGTLHGTRLLRDTDLPRQSAEIGTS